MDASLLATRSRIPPRPHHTAPRTRLAEALERGVQDDGYKLVLILAPAGYGKTTLLAQWAHASHARVAWLSLGEEDNDPDRFLRALLAAWQEVQPGVGESPLGLLLGSRDPDRDAVLAAFITVASALDGQTVFVLDDVHLIEDPAIHEALAFLLDHVPPTLHFVLAGRTEPPLPLARHRARHELLELRGEDLQFLADETAELLNQVLRLDLAADEIASLHEQLEGWAAGLQLASLTLSRHRAATPPVVSGRHRFIADYLSDEVLAHLPADTRRFLLQTSVLDGLCASLCDAVTQETGGQEMLERLERENLFLMPLDDNREWFRYHRLFADVLREEMQRHAPDEVREIHRRAAIWHLDRDMPEQAFQHALAGHDATLTAEIVERHAPVKLFRGEIRVVQRWIAALPDEWYASHPWLSLARAALLYFLGQLDACARVLDEVERLAIASGGAEHGPIARVTAMRCFIACYHNDLEQAKVLAQQALRDLPEQDLTFRGGVHVSLGDTYRLNGYWQEARASYLATFAFLHAPVPRIESVHVFGALADLDLRQGRLRDAAAHWKSALAVIQDQATAGCFPLPEIGWVYLRIAELLYERNELVDAWDHLQRGLERAELGGDARALLAGHLLIARMTLAAGDVEAAAASLERARPLLEQAPLPDWTSRFERDQIELWLAQNRLRAAVDWADAMDRSGVLEARPDSEAARLALARVAIVKGDQPSRERALALLGRLLRAAEAEGRAGVQIEALALQAMARWHGGERAEALTSLERALRLAEPEGYVRLFADLGLPMARLLQEAHSRKVMPDYVARLLTAFGADLELPASRELALPEPLGPREQEVLRLLAAGLTNREIAATLFISPETVKKHSSGIYSKLGVSNRTEAAARARKLDLLD